VLIPASKVISSPIFAYAHVSLFLPVYISRIYGGASPVFPGRLRGISAGYIYGGIGKDRRQETNVQNYLSRHLIHKKTLINSYNINVNKYDFCSLRE
jgi:hypothetical protein